MADIVVSDLAELEDWSSMDRIAELYRIPDENNWIRVPAIFFMRRCPKPEAKEYLREFEEIDAAAVERANFLLAYPTEEEDSDPESDDEPNKVDDKEEVAPDPLPKFMRPYGRGSTGFGC